MRLSLQWRREASPLQLPCASPCSPQCQLHSHGGRMRTGSSSSSPSQRVRQGYPRASTTSACCFLHPGATCYSIHSPSPPSSCSARLHTLHGQHCRRPGPSVDSSAIVRGQQWPSPRARRRWVAALVLPPAEPTTMHRDERHDYHPVAGYASVHYHHYLTPWTHQGHPDPCRCDCPRLDRVRPSPAVTVSRTERIVVLSPLHRTCT